MKKSTLVSDLAQATEAAALAVYDKLGSGDLHSIDRAAVDAMRTQLNTFTFDAEIAIGEGEKDNAPMLHVGERLGLASGAAVDLAVDPIDGTSAAALNQYGSIAALAAAPKGSMFRPGTIAYVHKLVGPPSAAGYLEFEAPLDENLRQLAKAQGKSVQSLRVAVLDRPRNQKFIDAIAGAGATPVLLRYADLSASVVVAMGTGDLDLLVGIGGAPEAVVAAAAIAAYKGVILCRLSPRDAREREQAIALGLDVDQILDAESLVGSGDLSFAATGVTGSELVDSMQLVQGQMVLHTLRIARCGGIRTTLRSPHKS